MRLYLVPCNAMANGNLVAEDRGLIEIHNLNRGGADPNGMKLRILLSYWYYKDTELDALFEKYFTPPYPDVFADSGGFSAMTQGAQIDVNEYAAWIKRYKHLFNTYANLDVIGDAGATLDNQHRLEDLGVEPIPVFHVNEDWTQLESYIEQYPYIALGGMVPYMRYTKKIMPWIIKAFKLAGDKSVFHGFGATSWEVIKNLPWYSVDSSSWGAGFRFGRVPLFDENKGKFVTAKLGDPTSCGKASRLFRSLGFDPLDFVDRSRNDRAKICAVSALSYMKAEQWLRERWGEIHIPKRNSEPVDLRVHIADANPARYGEAVAGSVDADLRLHLSDTSNGINYGDADKGLKVYGAVTGGSTEQKPAKNMSIASATEAIDGLNLYLADNTIPNGGGDIGLAMQKLKQKSN